MTRIMLWGLLAMALTFIGGIAVSAESGVIGGEYVAVESAALRLKLDIAADGSVTGALADAGTTMPLVARRQGTGITGVLGLGGATLPMTAILQGDRLVLEVGVPGAAERVEFRRRDEPTVGSPLTPVLESANGGRNVLFNGHRLSDADLARLEQAYQIRIPDADYWYDRVLGAWGVQGSPALGFIVPGLDLGGPLRADASGGGTGIFVNGRELHPYDVMALQGITGPIMPGRYFITAQGLAGLEGGAPLWNLAAMAAQVPGPGSHTWQGRVTGSSGFSDGTHSAVFLPNGGIVSAGP